MAERHAFDTIHGELGRLLLYERPGHLRSESPRCTDVLRRRAKGCQVHEVRETSAGCSRGIHPVFGPRKRLYVYLRSLWLGLRWEHGRNYLGNDRRRQNQTITKEGRDLAQPHCTNS